MKKIYTTLLLVIMMCQGAQAMIVEQLGIYKQYPVAPGMGNVKVNPPGSQVIKVTKAAGYYVDGKGQVPEYSRIAPPNPEAIPKNSHPTKTVVPFDSYYDRNVIGLRRHPYMTPVIPNYNRHYSERRAYPYTKQEYIDVWCTGEKNKNGIDCQSENYAITFIRARDWTWGVIKAPIKAKKSGKKTAIFLMVDDLGLDAQHMHDAKEWGELFNIPIFMGTIDSYIPLSWVI